MLPTGVSLALLLALVPTILNLTLAKAVLLEATLANVDISPAEDGAKQAVYNAFTDSISDHNSKLGDIDFPKDAQTLAGEETNLEVVLPHCIQIGSHAAIKAAIEFSWYQNYTRPRLDVIKAVMSFCRTSGIVEPLARSVYASRRPSS
ncbi:hypothetical protein FRB97_006796 [Tulasnella sp. 331]|nr:hypothetical protein FRB97_006796 [Tulasnella sp. 331]KAG8888174.1 hypothetical protein FRB98_008285 [Tulasnella sp. 332]